MARPFRRPQIFGALFAVLLLAGSSAMIPAAAARGARPRLRLVSARSEVTLERRRNYPVPLDVGVYLASFDAPFEVRASRADYTSPIQVSEWIDGGTVVHPLPAWTAEGWSGLRDFERVQIRRDSGRVISDTRTAFCPAGYDIERVDDSGPDQSRYPSFGCGANPFTLGAVWGIERGWAANIIDPNDYDPRSNTVIDARDGHYLVRFSITRPYRTLFGIANRDAAIDVGVTLVTGHSGAAGPTSSETPIAVPPAAPTMRHPARSSLPDLIPLPAWRIRVDRHRTGDFLEFAATVWNAGPSPLVVEGFRKTDTDVMDAYQYFYEDGQVVGRAPAGTLEYDARRGHEHWHFRQFAAYSLLDASKQRVVASDKEAFCLAPTDPIDLTRPGANWSPYQVGLFSACGGESSIWVRESLDAGWGDTYVQYLPGQSFDISDVPNGKYFVRVEANPLGRLHERNPANDVTLRRVFLRGRPGHRRVVVPDWHGIDSEGCCFY